MTSASTPEEMDMIDSMVIAVDEDKDGFTQDFWSQPDSIDLTAADTETLGMTCGGGTATGSSSRASRSASGSDSGAKRETSWVWSHFERPNHSFARSMCVILKQEVPECWKDI